MIEDWSVLWISLKVAILSLLVITPPGVLTGWLLARRDFPGKTLWETLVYAPLVLPPVVTGYFLLLVLGRRGILGAPLYATFGWQFSFNTTGAVLAAGVVSFPLLVRAVRLAVELVDPKLELAAATLGAEPFRVWRSITLPLALPGILAGMTLAFARGLGEFGATITFAGNIQGETRTLPLAIYNYLQMPGKESLALVLALLSVVLALGALWFSEYYSRKMGALLRGGP